MKKETTMKKETRTGYMCYTDFLHELGEARGGTRIYNSKEDCLAHNSCINECGMVKVKISFDKIVLKGDGFKQSLLKLKQSKV